METWQDRGVILLTRPHGEGGSVVSALTENHGLYSGYVPGGMSSKMRAVCQLGNLVQISWQARLSEYLGRFSLDAEKSYSASIFEKPMALKALKSACALCQTSLAERESNPAQFHGLCALLEILVADEWPMGYIAWEIGFLKEQGCSLDLASCVVTGDDRDLYYVSPKSGRAVCKKEGDPYKDKLLILPEFLKPRPDMGSAPSLEEQMLQGLKMTSYFIENYIYGQTTRPVPDARERLLEAFAEDSCV